ncbi:MAG TPA: threonine ammonia-lyase [Nitrospirota bacterium]|nr:threonine ammonia-lyase [Nitrospirota bacterium]
MISLSDIQTARERIAPFIHRTPLILSNSLSRLTGAEVYLKLENLQKTGSFKVRGAFNKLLSVAEPRVIAASMGNHAQAVAFAAGKLGKSSVIVMPETASLVKQEATRGYGAEVVLHGERFSDALEYALTRKDALFIHPFDDDSVIAGQGTASLEIAGDLRDIDAVLVPAGGGGLLAGTAAAIKALSPRTEVIGVQAAQAASACISFSEHRVCERVPGPTIADGIAVGRVGVRTLEYMTKFVDGMLSVEEDAIARAILLFLERKKLVVEGAGAVPLAALLTNAGQFRGRRVVLLVSGGNIDFTLVDRIILKGLVTSGRIGVFSVVIDDVAGSLHAVTGVIGEQKANILDVDHARLGSDVPIGRTKVVFTVEVRGKEHLAEVFDALREKGYEAGAA